MRTIGETLDASRVPTPHENDLACVADAFIGHTADPAIVPASAVVKVVPAAEFSVNDRWDVARFWSEEELVSLGVKAEAIDQADFIDFAMANIKELLAELEASKVEISALTSGPTCTIPLSDAALFLVRSGTRIRNEDIRANPGDIPVYSCFKERAGSKGRISEQYLVSHGVPHRDGSACDSNGDR